MPIERPHRSSAPAGPDAPGEKQDVANFDAAREAAAMKKAAAAYERANAPVSVSEAERATILEKTSEIIGRYRATDALLTAFISRQTQATETLKEDDYQEGHTPALTDSQLRIAAREALEDAVRAARDYNLADAKTVIDAYPNNHTEMEFFAAAKRTEEILGTPA